MSGVFSRKRENLRGRELLYFGRTRRLLKYNLIILIFSKSQVTLLLPFLTFVICTFSFFLFLVSPSDL